MHVLLRLVCGLVVGALPLLFGCASDDAQGMTMFGRMDAGTMLPPPAGDAAVRQVRCGDGLRQGSEQCDDGNLNDGDGCDRMCRTEVLCGNGRVDRGEACDDGNQEAGDGCNSVCQREPLCGNGRVDDDEECDEAQPDCAECRVLPVDVSAGGEFPGQFQDLSFDRFTFTLRADGIVQMTATDGAAGCPSDMDLALFRTRPGNIRDEIEMDADGGPGFCPRISQVLIAGNYEVIVRGAQRQASESYVFTIRFPGVCGDGVIHSNEYCDDGNLANGDGCSAECTYESTCGNGNLEGLEECDDGNENNGDGCDRGCTLEDFDLVRGSAQIESSVGDGSRDTFRFTVDGRSAVWARSSSGNGECLPGIDTVLTLYRLNDGGAREEIASNDDAPGLQFCSEIMMDLEPGVYDFVVGDLFGGDPIDAYVFEFELYQDVSAGGAFPGAFADDGDDRFRLNVRAQRRMQIRTEGRLGACAGDTQLWLSQETEGGLELVEMADDTDRNLCSVIERTLDPGDYHIRVNGFQGSPIEAYELFVLFEGQCGDGFLNIDEDCDDGNARDGDGCSARCRAETLCGNGAMDDNEECDDGNELNGDGCDAGCSLENFDLVSGREKRTGEVGVEGQDVWRFAVDGPSQLTVQTHDGMDACPDGFDTVLQVFRIDGANRILQFENDDLADDVLCAGLNEALDAGTYEIVVSDFQADERLRYGLDFLLAQDVSAGGEFNGAFVMSGDDVYTLSVPEAIGARFTTGGDGMCPGNTLIVLSSVDGEGNLTEVARDDDGAEGMCSNLLFELQPGNYELEVSGVGDVPIMSYVLDVRLGDTGQ